MAMLALASITLSGCFGPRMQRLDEAKYPRRPSMYPIELYISEAFQPNRKIAIIESTAFPVDTDEARWEAIGELEDKARRLGADAIEDLHLHTKRVQGFTADERTPFPSIKQGYYELFFMRGTAIIYESSLPGALTRKAKVESTPSPNADPRRAP
jgi:uncharacterized protein YbjQ (UPF0145 family)